MFSINVSGTLGLQTVSGRMFLVVSSVTKKRVALQLYMLSCSHGKWSRLWSVQCGGHIQLVPIYCNGGVWYGTQPTVVVCTI